MTWLTRSKPSYSKSLLLKTTNKSMTKIESDRKKALEKLSQKFLRGSFLHKLAQEEKLEELARHFTVESDLHRQIQNLRRD